MSGDSDRVHREFDALLREAAHDLRAPLRSIEGFSRALVEEKGAQLDDEARHYLRRITDASTELARIVNEMLTRAREV